MDQDHFWTMGNIEAVEIHPTLPDVYCALLKRLGPSPLNIGKKNLNAYLFKVYEEICAAAVQKSLEL